MVDSKSAEMNALDAYTLGVEMMVSGGLVSQKKTDIACIDFPL